MIVLNTTFYAYFHVRVALFKWKLLRVPCRESWTPWAQMKSENLKNSKMVQHVCTGDRNRYRNITQKIDSFTPSDTDLRTSGSN